MNVNLEHDFLHGTVQSGVGSKRELVFGLGVVVAAVAAGGLIGYFLGRRNARMNTKQRLQCDKVVDSVDLEDIGDQKAFCRCWKSGGFPYCDGSHNKHNKATGDNVGPLLVRGKPKD